MAVRRLARRRLLSLLWAAYCAVLAPGVLLPFGAVVGVARVMLGEASVGRRPPCYAVLVYLGTFTYLAATLFGLAPLVVVLTLWSCAAPKLGVFENSARGLAAATATVAALASMLAQGISSDGAWLTSAGVGLSTWIGLLVPRLSSKYLPPGAPGDARRGAG